MFSIWTKGIDDSLNRTPGGAARLTSLINSRISSQSERYGINPYLHNAIPSLSASSKSPACKGSCSASSIHNLTSFAACGVYLDRRMFLISLSKDDTEAISTDWSPSARRRLLRAGWQTRVGANVVLLKWLHSIGRKLWNSLQSYSSVPSSLVHLVTLNKHDRGGSNSAHIPQSGLPASAAK